MIRFDELLRSVHFMTFHMTSEGKTALNVCSPSSPGTITHLGDSAEECVSAALAIEQQGGPTAPPCPDTLPPPIPIPDDTTEGGL